MKSILLLFITQLLIMTMTKNSIWASGSLQPASSSSSSLTNSKTVTILNCGESREFDSAPFFDLFVSEYFWMNFKEAGAKYLESSIDCPTIISFLKTIDAGGVGVGHRLKTALSSEVEHIAKKYYDSGIRTLYFQKRRTRNDIWYRVHRVIGILEYLQSTPIDHVRASLESLIVRIPYHSIYTTSAVRLPLTEMLTEFKSLAVTESFNQMTLIGLKKIGRLACDDRGR